MSSENDAMNRIRYLERTNRVIFALLVIVVVASGVSVFLAWGASHRNVFRGTEFVMTDGHGNALAKLSHRMAETCLELRGQQQVTTAALCVGDDYGADLFLANHGGADRAFLSAGSRLGEGGGGALQPGLVISQADGEKLISAILANETKIVVGSGSEKNSVLILANAERPLIRVLDTNGKTVWTSPSK